MLVLLIGPDNKAIGKFTRQKAEQIAEEEYGLDLIEVQPDVFKILDQGKQLYRQGKKKQVKPKPTKEIKFKLNIGPADFDTKIRAIQKFLKAGSTVKVTVWFTGREISRPEAGSLLVHRVQEAVLDCGVMEGTPNLLGKNLHAIVVPRK